MKAFDWFDLTDLDVTGLDVTGLAWCEMGLRHVLSSLARKSGAWVRIPYSVWMLGVCRCLFSVYVVLCLGRGLAMS